MPPERFEKSISITLANARARELSVVFDADLATGEKIGNRCDGFLSVLCAGTDRKDKVTERQFGTGLEDLMCLFHGNLQRIRAVPVPFRSILPRESGNRAPTRRITRHGKHAADTCVSFLYNPRCQARRRNNRSVIR